MRSYTSSPPKRLHGVWRDCFTAYFTLCMEVRIGQHNLYYNYKYYNQRREYKTVLSVRYQKASP
jgi:hypothetical protein